MRIDYEKFNERVCVREREQRREENEKSIKRK